MKSSLFRSYSEIKVRYSEFKSDVKLCCDVKDNRTFSQYELISAHIYIVSRFESTIRTGLSLSFYSNSNEALMKCDEA